MNTDDLPLIDSPDGWHHAIPKLPRDLIYSAVRSGELKAIRSGRRILIPRRALLDWFGETEPED